MTNPLEEKYRVYETMTAVLRIMRLLQKSETLRALGIDKDRVQILLGDTGLSGLMEQDIRNRLDEAEEHLKAVVALTLFATFEKTLRMHLKSHLSPVGAAVSTPVQLAASLHQYLEKECLWWNTEELLDLFDPPVQSQTRGNAKQIKKYRDFVAHQMREAAPVDPERAFQWLTAFLSEARLIPATSNEALASD